VGAFLSQAANQQSDAAGNKEEKHVSESDGGKELVPLCKLTQPLEAYKYVHYWLFLVLCSIFIASVKSSLFARL